MEYSKKEGIGKKFLEGILVSFVIMGLFFLLQLLIGFVGVMAAVAACILQTGMDAQDAQRAAMRILMNGNFMTMLTVVSTFAMAVFSVPAYWLVWGRRRTAQDRQYFRENVLRIRTFSMIVIGCVGLYYLALLIAAAIAVASPETMESYTDMMESALGGSQILAMLAAVILAPINEECIMRGLILKNLQRHFSTPAVILIQAVMFGVFHANWVQGLYVLPVGAALGYVAVKCRSVLPCIFMHLLYNSLSFVVVMLPTFCQTGAFAIGAVVVSAAAVWYLGRTAHAESEQAV
ncbi:MAG: CPBP family intramembrane metalloprotease [Lachnospiraceae bacterium]|nr:CPBP family intramembrane metalloprotease [Lachnospiraceae bacterium]